MLKLPYAVAVVVIAVLIVRNSTFELLKISVVVRDSVEVKTLEYDETRVLAVGTRPVEAETAAQKNVTHKVEDGTATQQKLVPDEVETRPLSEFGTTEQQNIIPNIETRARESDTTTQQKAIPKIICKNTYRSGMRKISCQDENDPIYGGLPGQWIYNKSHTTYFTGSTCCKPQDRSKDPDSPDAKLCGVKRQGGSNYTGSPDHLAQLPGFGCMCKMQSKQWVWHTPSGENGELLPAHFDKEEACQLLGNRTVLLIGDSTMQQTATSLMNAFYPTKCAGQISYNQADTLVGRAFTYSNRGKHWKKNVLSWFRKPDIVVLAGGAHVHQDRDYMFMIRQVMQEMKELQPQYPNMHFVFKTQQPAGCVHPHHSNATNLKKFNPKPWKPENPTLAARALDWTYYKHGYVHDTFYDRDLWLMDQVQNKTGEDSTLNFHVLDIRPLYSRTDRHLGSTKHPAKDCLHYCVPGPLDIVAPLFQQLLVESIGSA